MNPTPVVVVGGYLGAGKTTFINDILRRTDQRITVLVNDFGSINIDATLIKNVNGDTIELTNGCVCCAVGDDLTAAMLTIVDSPTRPDLVLIETSGVADPRVASTYAHMDGLLAGAILVIVDALHVEGQLQNRLIGSTVRRQIEAADLVLVSKTGDAIPGEVLIAIGALNPVAPVVRSADFDMSLNGLAVGGQGAEATGVHEIRHSSRIEHPAVHDDMSALGWLRALDQGVVRAKGIVAAENGNLLLERIGTHCSVRTTDIPPTGGVVVISV